VHCLCTLQLEQIRSKFSTFFDLTLQVARRAGCLWQSTRCHRNPAIWFVPAVASDTQPQAPARNLVVAIPTFN
jgi:hypothetical protein